MGTVITIAHNAGNRHVSLEEALDAAVDAVEADLRLDGDRLVARHERKPLPLPIFLDKWYVRWSGEPQVTLDEILQRVKGRASLFVDLKSKSAHAVEMLLATLKRQEAIAETRISSTYWHLLRWLREAEPRLLLYYSIGHRRTLARFWRLREDDPSARAVSIHQALVDEEVAKRFRARDTEIVAYHVNDLSRARELIGWGVQGITSDNLGVLRALKGSSPTNPPG
jgi:glycerophosphoryl diester phosphodiesterase